MDLPAVISSRGLRPFEIPNAGIAQPFPTKSNRQTKMTESEQRFIEAWAMAGPELERIRQAELRQLDQRAGILMISRKFPEPAQFSGLAVFQSWMMRLRVIELMKSAHESN